MRTWLTVIAGIVALSFSVMPLAQAGEGGITQVVSLSGAEELGNDISGGGAISKGAHYVAFSSYATNLVPNDLNNISDAFVRDRVAGTVERVSVSNDGTEGNSFSFPDAISADGRFVAFSSAASNLIPGDTANTYNIYIRDRVNDETELVDVGIGGHFANGATAPGADMTPDGRYVVFVSRARNLTTNPSGEHHLDVFLRDRELGTTRLVSVGYDGSAADKRSEPGASISADGRYVAFASKSTNLVPGDSNKEQDVFVRDLVSGTTTLVSVGRNGDAALGSSRLPDISNDGRKVSFASSAGNLVRGDTNDFEDIFVRNLVGGNTQRISLLPDGSEPFPHVGTNANNSISARGRFVAFNYGVPLVDGLGTEEEPRVYLWDRATKQVQLVSVDPSGEPVTNGSALGNISAHGQYATFTGDGQVYLRVLTRYH